MDCPLHQDTTGTDRDSPPNYARAHCFQIHDTVLKLAGASLISNPVTRSIHCQEFLRVLEVQIGAMRSKLDAESKGQ